MRKLALALTAAAALTMGTSANAAKVITISGPSGTFGNDSVTPGTFSDSYDFAGIPGFSLASLTLTSVMSSPETALDFTSATFNGAPFALTNGVIDSGFLLNQPLLSGNNNITVAGTSGANAAYSGVISLSQTPAVPEPATWMFMLVGFGAVGYSMRKKTAVKFAQSV